jgi:hypothetical protein
MVFDRADEYDTHVIAVAHYDAGGVFGAVIRRNPSGPAVMAPHKQAGHMNALDPTPGREENSCIRGAVGRPRWLVELIRCRAGESADFELEACDDKGHLRLPADLVHRPGQAEGGRHSASA